jgi:hypothetical protein
LQFGNKDSALEFTLAKTDSIARLAWMLVSPQPITTVVAEMEARNE